MSTKFKWLVALGLATALVGTIIVVTNTTSQTEAQLRYEIQKLEHKTKEQQRQEVEQLNNKIKELDAKVQAKAEKARLAQIEADKRSLAQRVVQSAVPTANAATKPQNASGDIQSIIVKWANHYGVNAQHLLNIARCESTFNPNARNTGYTAGAAGNPVGLFQHVEGYWPARAARYGVPGASIYDADAQARVTAAMFADGQAHLWECR